MDAMATAQMVATDQTRKRQMLNRPILKIAPMVAIACAILAAPSIADPTLDGVP